MEEKERNAQPGRRLEKETGKAPGRAGKIAAIVTAAVAVLLAGGYLGVCALAGGPRVLPGVRLGGVDLGGMDQAQAQAALERVSRDRYEALEIPIQVGEETVTFSAKDAGAHVDGGAAEALAAGKDGFFARGWNYLTGLLGRKTDLSYAVRVDNAGYVDQVLTQAAQAVDQPVEQPHWELEEDEESARLILHQGRTGQSVDQAALRQALEDALGRGDAAPIQAEIASTAPSEPDLDALVREVDRESVNATLNVETEEVIPHKLGLKVDPAAAAELFSDMAEGESRPLELEVEVPEVTTLALRSTLFQDVLGEASSKVTGSAARVGNVTLAAKACDGKVVLPGETFSYNQTTGQRTYDKGYRMATGFTAKGTEDMIGGGVCQPSSTLYLACLRADLQIAQRYNHRYTVTYMPEGMDATVSWPNVDFAFVNNTAYPIKVEMEVQDKQCVARLRGTKTTDTYVEMESVRLGTTPYATIYQADPTVPQGTTNVLVSPFTGRTVEVYKNLYAGDGTLISRTKVSKDVYRKCDKVVAYNPLDGAPDGSVPPVDPVTGQPVVPSAAPSADPNAATPPESADPNATTPPEPPAPSADPSAVTPPEPPAPSADPNAVTPPEPPAPSADPNATTPPESADPNAATPPEPPAPSGDPNAATPPEPPAPSADPNTAAPPEPPAPEATPAPPPGVVVE